ncbi:MAG: hypothetical protein JWO07_211 [Candidatus Saccharibacteria bacterium]|nr:hypothetical protein [Candidatus Saccharibacteria bacterium]
MKKLLIAIFASAMGVGLINLAYLLEGSLAGIATAQQCTIADFQNTVPGLLALQYGAEAILSVVSAVLVYRMCGDTRFRRHWGELNVARWALTFAVGFTALVALYFGRLTCVQIAAVSGWVQIVVAALHVALALVVMGCTVRAALDAME